MQWPGTPSLVFLAILLVGLPAAAIRSAARLRQAGDTAAGAPSLERIWRGTLLLQAFMLWLSWLVGDGFGYRLFVLEGLGAAAWLEAAGALALLWGMRLLLRASRSAGERRGLVVFRLAPRTRRQWGWCLAATLAAAVAEEAAFRGVGHAILWYALGSPWPATLLCAVAFALTHWPQGWKSGVFIFATALVMHALVLRSGSLVPAMAVHLAFDLAAMALIAREAPSLGQSTG